MEFPSASILTQDEIAAQSRSATVAPQVEVISHTLNTPPPSAASSQPSQAISQVEKLATQPQPSLSPEPKEVLDSAKGIPVEEVSATEKTLPSSPSVNALELLAASAQIHQSGPSQDLPLNPLYSSSSSLPSLS